MIFAEKCREGGDDGYYTLRYFVWNGEWLGTYGVHYSPRGAYGASRDYHRPANKAEIALQAEWDAFNKLPKEEQEARYAADTEPAYGHNVDTCTYWDDVLCACDGSSLVEVITDNEQRAYEIAAMMAGARQPDPNTFLGD